MSVNLKNAWHESCYIWGNVRTAAQEIAPQIALRNCSREVEGKDSMYVILVKGEWAAIKHIF